MVQTTHDIEQMLGADAASLLLGLEGLAVQEVLLDGDGGRVVHLVTCSEAAAACPGCGVLSCSPKGSATTRPRDLGWGPDPVRLVWHKRRWRCREPLCRRSSFTESLPAVAARARLTRRLRAEVGQLAADGMRCVQAAADRYQVSWPVAHRALVDHVEPRLAAETPPVRVLGIDEIRRGRPVFEHDAETGRWTLVKDRWLTGLVDAAGAGGLLAHVEGRAAADVSAWLDAQPQEWRDAISHVSMDLSASYAKAVRDSLPGAVVVADRFHLVRLGNQALTQVRQRLTREQSGRRGGTADPQWRLRRRLLTGWQRLRPDSFVEMWNQLVDLGDPGMQILTAWVVKENLRSLLALAGTNPDRAEIRTRLDAFYLSAADSTAPEIHRLATTVEDWWPAVLAGILTGHNNARSEGYNRLAKHEGRNAFGFRNTDNQQRRIRYACTRQHRRSQS
jgi:transposase